MKRIRVKQQRSAGNESWSLVYEHLCCFSFLSTIQGYTSPFMKEKSEMAGEEAPILLLCFFHAGSVSRTE